jgi:opacity protein-like surface antigen
MKKILAILTILLAFSVTATAQTPSSPIKLYATGGVSLPMSPDLFKDYYKMGFHFGGGVGYALMPNLQLIGKAEYHMFAPDVEDIEGGDLKLSMFGGDLKFSLGLPAAPIKPYLLGGAGFAKITVDAVEGFDEESYDETKFYFNVGAGLDLVSNPAFSLFIQGRYVSVMTDDESTAMVPISAGIRFF